ncbi:MAG: hypothetical protein ACJ8G2_16995 [Burkholderiales bacterium]
MSVGMLVAPCVLLLQLTIAYAVVHLSCANGLPASVLHSVFAAALLVTLLMLGLAWHAWRVAVTGHERFLNQLSLALSALVVLVIAAQWVTVSILQPCVSSL